MLACVPNRRSHHLDLLLIQDSMLISEHKHFFPLWDVFPSFFPSFLPLFLHSFIPLSIPLPPTLPPSLSPALLPFLPPSHSFLPSISSPTPSFLPFLLDQYWNAERWRIYSFYFYYQLPIYYSCFHLELGTGSGYTATHWKPYRWRPASHLSASKYKIASVFPYNLIRVPSRPGRCFWIPWSWAL